MATKKRTGTCENCIYLDTNVPKSAIVGICRRYPPHLNGLISIPSREWWCGEWARQTETKPQPVPYEVKS